MRDSKITITMIEKFILVLFVILSLNFIIIDMGFSQERRNPFKDWFPIIKPEVNITSDVPIVVFQPERTFDTYRYKVEGLIWGTSKPKAIIDSKIYGIGDKLDEADITKIDKNGVTLTFDEKEYVITTKKMIDIQPEVNSTISHPYYPYKGERIDKKDRGVPYVF